jgi:CHAT domain-containing protein
MREAARLRPGSPLPRDTATAFATLALLQAESGDAAAAFDTSERMRVHDLRATLVGYEREIARGTTAEERTEERDGAAAIASLRAQIARERRLPRPDAARLAAFETRLAAAIASRGAQQDRLFERLPALRRWRGMFEPARTADLAPLLATDDTLLLDLVVGDDGLLVMAAWLEEGAVKVVGRVAAMPRRTIAEAVGRMLQPNILKDPASWRAESASLVAALPPEAVVQAARARRVLIVPHEMLWRVPFEALAPGGRELAATAEVTYLPSVSAGANAAGGSLAAVRGLLASGAPELSAALATRVAQTAPGWTIRPAAGVRPELDKTGGDSRAADRVVLAGAEGTETAMRRAMPEAGTIHIANPFRVNAASPLFSPILLSAEAPADTPASSGPAAAAADGVLELREIMNLELRAASVVLSDPSALSMRDAADDVAIVQWAWWAAGVPSMALTRWAAQGAAQELFIRELHTRLRAGRSLPAAAQAARLAVRRSAGWSAPFYWAGWLVAAGR